MAQEARKVSRSVVILGVGNRLRGDDAVGCILCDKLCTDLEENSPPRRKDTKGPSAESSIVNRPSSVPEETGTVPSVRRGQTRGEFDAAAPSACPLGGTVPASSLALGDLGGCSPTDRVCVVDCGSTPENYIQPVADRNPTRILVVDCCDYGAKPGEFRLFSRPEVEQLSYGLLSTHTLPLTLTIEMLSLQTHATIELLGIQPERIEFGGDLSEPVRRALPAMVEFVCNWAKAGTAAS